MFMVLFIIALLCFAFETLKSTSLFFVFFEILNAFVAIVENV